MVAVSCRGDQLALRINELEFTNPSTLGVENQNASHRTGWTDQRAADFQQTVISAEGSLMFLVRRERNEPDRFGKPFRTNR